MSWLFSQALVAEYSAVTCLDGAPSAQSNGNPIPQAYCVPDKMTAFSRLSRFGMTFAPLTESRGEELLMSYQVAFRAKTSALRGGGEVSLANEAASGKRWHGLLARFDPVSSSWRTAQCSLLEDLEQCLETWPRWGSMRNGACYQQPMLERHINENESGYLADTYSGNWPTPTCADTRTDKLKLTQQKAGSMHSVSLAQAVQMWPTPSATDGKRGGVMTENMTGQSLTQVVNTLVRFPTPCATDHNGSGKMGALRDRLDYAVERGATKSNTYQPHLNDQIGGQLNPTWVEWLMGWPLGWTDLKPLEMGKFQAVPQPHSDCCVKELEYEQA